MLEELLNNRLDLYDLSEKQLDVIVNEIENKVHTIKELIYIKCIFIYEKDVIKKRIDYLSKYISYDSFLEEKRKQKRHIVLKQIIHKIDSKLDTLEYLEEIKNRGEILICVNKKI